MRHFEKVVEHEGFSVSFWVDPESSDITYDWHPGWTGELVRGIESVIDLYSVATRDLVSAVSSTIEKFAASITEILSESSQ